MRGRQRGGQVRRRLPAEERRQQFLNVAARLAVEHGVEAVTMEAVAEGAGVSKTLGYAYFENRVDLLLAVFEREMAELQGRAVRRLRAGAHTFEDHVRAAAGAWFDHVEERGPLLATLMQSGLLRGTLEERQQRAIREWSEFYGELAAAEYRLPKTTAVLAANVLISGLRGALQYWEETGGSRSEVEEAYVRMIIGAIRELAGRDPSERVRGDRRTDQPAVDP
jgi:AcrR family transcriptional regulator